MFLTVLVLVLLAVSGIPIRRTKDTYFVKVDMVINVVPCCGCYVATIYRFLLLTVDVM